MANAVNKPLCITCDKQIATFICKGCLQEFCIDHVSDHRQNLSQQLDDIDIKRDLFQEQFNEQKALLHNHSLIQKINQWEDDSIKTIHKTAEEAKQLLNKRISGTITEIEMELNKLTGHLKQSRQQNGFFELELNQWKEQLAQLSEELDMLSHITLRGSSTPLITQIFVEIDAGAARIPNGITVAGGSGRGDALNQLLNPYGMCVDNNQAVYIADYSNNRIVKWKSGATSGEIVAGGNGFGNRTDQLCRPSDVIIDTKTDCLIICDQGNRRIVRWPRQNGTSGEIIILDIDCYGLAMDSDGYLYVSDHIKHEVKRWRIGDTDGTLVAGGNGQGNRLDQVNNPTYIFVDKDHSVYVSDQQNYRMIKWEKGAKEGIVVAGGRGKGSDLTQLASPHGVVVDEFVTVYVADTGNNRIVRWPKGATQGSVVAGNNEKGDQPHQLSDPVGLSFDRQNNLYVVDWGNQRVQKFNIEANVSG